MGRSAKTNSAIPLTEEKRQRLLRTGRALDVHVYGGKAFVAALVERNEEAALRTCESILRYARSLRTSPERYVQLAAAVLRSSPRNVTNIEYLGSCKLKRRVVDCAKRYGARELGDAAVVSNVCLTTASVVRSALAVRRRVEKPRYNRPHAANVSVPISIPDPNASSELRAIVGWLIGNRIWLDPAILCAVETIRRNWPADMPVGRIAVRQRTIDCLAVWRARNKAVAWYFDECAPQLNSIRGEPYENENEIENEIENGYRERSYGGDVRRHKGRTVRARTALVDD